MKKLAKTLCTNTVLLSLLLASSGIHAETPADKVIAADQKEILDLKAIIQKQDQYSALVQKQRDQAYDELKKDPGNGLPFYFWVVIGAAGSAFLIKGFTK